MPCVKQTGVPDGMEVGSAEPHDLDFIPAAIVLERDMERLMQVAHPVPQKFWWCYPSNAGEQTSLCNTLGINRAFLRHILGRALLGWHYTIRRGRMTP